MDRLRWVLRALVLPESLPPVPERTAPRERQAGRLLRWLVVPEPLPRDPPPPRRSPGRLLRWLFALERLPRGPEPR